MAELIRFPLWAYKMVTLLGHRAASGANSDRTPCLLNSSLLRCLLCMVYKKLFCTYALR